jgi:hypothetical protein
MKQKKLNLSGTIAIVLAILVLFILVPINLIVSYYDKGFDMTPSKKYTLSDKTVELLDNTSDKHIDIYFLYKLEEFQRADASELLPLYHTLKQLDERDNITLTCFEPDENASLANQLDPDGNTGIARGDLFVKCNNVVKKIGHSKFFQQGTDGVRQYAGEELIAAAISTCASGSLPCIYFLTGHGEKSINNSLQTYAEQLKRNDYDVQELDLDKEGTIPANAKIIYLAGPQKDLTDKEKELLSDYADNGGALSFLIDPCDTKGRFYNIEAIMEKFGLILDYNIVTETAPANQLQDRDSKQNENFFRVEYPAGGQYNEEFTEDLTSDLNELVNDGSYIAGISYARSVTEIPEDSFPGAAYTERSTIIRNVADANGNYSTASRSMGGDDVTAQQADEMLSEMVLDFGYYSYNKTSGGKMIFIGTTSVIDQDMISVSVSGTQMLALFSNTWLYDSDIQFGVGNKLNSYDYMIFKDSKEATSVMVIVYIIPAVLAIFGIAVWIKRRNS